jgi:hypothetical protein
MKTAASKIKSVPGKPETWPKGCVIELERENKRLAEALANANEQAERFEREWYLRGDEIERLQDEATDAREQQPVAYRAWFDKDNGARWLFTLWPKEERLDVDWEPLFTAPKATIPG